MFQVILSENWDQYLQNACSQVKLQSDLEFLTVINKIDLLTDSQKTKMEALNQTCLSCSTGEGVQPLVQKLTEKLEKL